MCTYQTTKQTSWGYIFVHYAMTDKINAKIKEKFNTFIHTSIVYKRENRHIVKEERPTVSGLIFIQGASDVIQQFLSEHLPGVYLVKDSATKQPAVINDHVMRAFMRIAQMPTRIRFLQHDFDYYSEGHPLIRITSGILAGMEGYRIRIARDRCLVTTIGGMTIAIGGVHKESFENLSEYDKIRRMELGEREQEYDSAKTALQTQIEQCFYTPSNQLDVITISANLSPWLTKAEDLIQRLELKDAAEIPLHILDYVGQYFKNMGDKNDNASLADIVESCRVADGILSTILNHPSAETDLKEYITNRRRDVAEHHPFIRIKGGLQAHQ